MLVFDDQFNLVDVAFQQLDAAFVQPVGSTIKAPHQLLSPVSARLQRVLFLRCGKPESMPVHRAAGIEAESPPGAGLGGARTCSG